jgi:hypothetical protein
MCWSISSAKLDRCTPTVYSLAIGKNGLKTPATGRYYIDELHPQTRTKNPLHVMVVAVSRYSVVSRFEKLLKIDTEIKGIILVAVKGMIKNTVPTQPPVV